MKNWQEEKTPSYILKQQEYSLLSKQVQAANLELDHLQKQEEITAAMNSISTAPNGGDILSIYGQGKIHQAKSKVTFGMIKHKYADQAAYQCTKLNANLKYYKVESEKTHQGRNRLKIVDQALYIN